MSYDLKTEFSIYTLTAEAKEMADRLPEDMDKGEWANAYVTEEIERQAAQLIYTLGDMLNASATTPAVVKGMLNGMLRQHRYLQGETMSALSQFLTQYGNVEQRHIDGRNEFAVKMAKRMGTASTNFNND
jgi:hypothetical protein